MPREKGMKLAGGEFIYGTMRRRWIRRGDEHEANESRVAGGVENLPEPPRAGEVTTEL